MVYPYFTIPFCMLLIFSMLYDPIRLGEPDCRTKLVGVNQETNCRVDVKCVIDLKIPGTGTLEAAQVRS